MRATGSQLGAASSSVRAVLANAGLRRIVAGWGGGIAGDNTLLIALLVVAFQQGGAIAVGLLGVIRLAPSVVVAPLAGNLAGRYPPTRLLLAVQAIRAIAAVVTVLVLMIGAGLPLIFLVNAVGATAGALVRPFQAAALPSLAGTPGELVAANVALATSEGLGSFGGPLIAGILLATSGPLAAAIAGASLFGIASLSMVGLGANADDEAEVAAGLRAREALAERRTAGGRFSGLTAGIRVMRRRPGAAAIIAGFGGQVVTRGLMNTLITVAAIRLIGLGEPGVGTLNAAFGLGTLIGAIASVGLTSRQRLGPAFAVSLAMWGLPLGVIGAVPWPIVAFAAMFVSGAANGTEDVAGLTLLQRAVPTAERMTVFGILEATVSLGMGLGSILGPLLIAQFGDQGALAIAGAILPIVAVATWPRIHRIDDEVVVPAEQLTILRGAPMFARLPLTALERIAEAMRAVPYAPETEIVREGETGDAYLIVGSGRVEVSQGGRPIDELGPGEGFGEIALLHAMPRTATVRAIEPSTIYTIACHVFLEAVAGPTSAAVANRVAAERLARAPASNPG